MVPSYVNGLSFFSSQKQFVTWERLLPNRGVAGSAGASPSHALFWRASLQVRHLSERQLGTAIESYLSTSSSPGPFSSWGGEGE